MKKLLLLLMVFLLVMSTARATSIYLTNEELRGIIEVGDWAGFLDDYFLPELIYNQEDMLYFASELNISNGERERWGERYMFGKLVSAPYMRDHMNDYVGDAPAIAEEVYRLLLGPWLDKGGTSFSIYNKNYKWNGLIDGEWTRINHPMTIIRIEHTTDRYGEKRYAYLGLWESDDVYCAGLTGYELVLVRKAQ